jgi:PST family polysaccharide transporter
MFWMAWGSAAGALLKIGVLVALTRLLAPADFGLISAALIVIWIAAGFSQLGLGAALVQRPTLEPRHEHVAFLSSVVLGFGIAAIVYLAAPAVAAFYRMPALVPVVRALALMFPLRGLGTASEFLLRRDLRFRLIANVELGAYALGYGAVGVVLALYGWGVWALVMAQLAQSGLVAIAVLIVRPPARRERPSWQALRDLLGFGTSYTGAYLAVLLANHADNLVVGRWMGPVALGLYSRAYQLMAVPTTQVGDVLDGVLFPILARVQHDRQRLAAAYLRASALIALMMLPVSVVLLVLAPEVIRAAFGERWLAVVPLFQTLAIAMVLRTNYRMSDSLARAVGIGFGRVWRQTLYAVLVCAGAWVGHYWGLNGVPIGVVGALLINYVLMAQLALGVITVPWWTFLAAQAPGVRWAIVAGGLTWAVVAPLRTWGVPVGVRLTITGTVLLLVAVLLVWRAPPRLFGPHGEWMRNTLHDALARRFGQAHRASTTGSLGEGVA